MNWGWRITITLLLFISFILYMVVYSFYTTNDLVAEDYYNQEIQYQENIDAQKNALPFAKGVILKATTDAFEIKFPAYFNIPFKDGHVSFYRPENEKLDTEFTLNLDGSNRQFLDRKKLVPGFYKVTIQFTDGEKVYLINKEIRV